MSPRSHSRPGGAVRPAPSAAPSTAPRRAAALAALAGLVLTGACNVRSGDGSAPSAERQETVGGEVAPAPWSPPAAPQVRGVPLAEVRTAVGARLAEGRPTPLTEAQWRHARALYRRFGGTPLWLGADGPDPARTRALLRAVVSADQDALRLDAYPLTALAQAMAAIREGSPTAAQLAEADVLLTSAFAALGDDLLSGQVEPRAVSQDWHIDTKESALDSALVRSLAETDLDRALDRMRPVGEEYRALRQALVRYRELDAQGGWPTVPTGRAVKPGEPERAARLDALRQRLVAEGLLTADGRGTSDARRDAASAVPEVSAAGSDARTGDTTAADAARRATRQVRRARPGETLYDETLAGAVAAYQARHAIAVDSVLGEETVKSMNLPASYRVEQIAANLERHRWMPRALGQRHIVVNVPAFHLEAWENGKPALDMKVVVGKDYEDRKTAVFADTMTTIVFRPYWFITDDIAEKETWPKIRENPGYMKANNLETWRENGKTRLRQLPGDSNSLGLVKFLFPNTFNIYLHDTPQKALFGKDVRAFSHGCIRLEKPGELAQWVLGWSADSVRSAMQGAPDNKEVKVPQRVPVYITYFTAYQRDGQLHFGNDLYDRDADMLKAMRAAGGQKPEVVEAVNQLRELAGR